MRGEDVEVHAVREVVHEAVLVVEVTEKQMVALLPRRLPAPGPTTPVLPLRPLRRRPPIGA